jgi:hypothetical protein
MPVQRKHVASRNRRGAVSGQAACMAVPVPVFISIPSAVPVPVHSFPHFQTVDGNVRVDLEAEFHLRAPNVEHRDFQQAMKAIGPPDDDRLLSSPRQD